MSGSTSPASKVIALAPLAVPDPADATDGDPTEALERYRSAIQVWHDAGADGPVTTTLRNLIVLLARIGADEEALTISSALERLATSPAYGPAARRLSDAVDVVTERSPTSRLRRSATAAAGLPSLDAVAMFALAAIDDVRACR